MALIEVLFGNGRKARIGVVQLDASVQEQHSKAVEVPLHPVEAGADISDHVRPLPEELTINGVVSNHPVVLLATLRAPSPIITPGFPSGERVLQPPTEDRVEAAYAELRRVMDAGELVTVSTTLRDYSDMAIVGLQVSRDAQNGNVLNAQIALRQVILATVEQVAAPEPVTAANVPTKNLGAKDVKPAPAGFDLRSVLRESVVAPARAVFAPAPVVP